MLRLGMATVFITGGLWKLSRLLSPAQADGIVLALLGGGRAFTPADIASRCRDYLDASSALRRKV